MDCFKFMMWNWETIKNLLRVAVDCNNPEAKIETVVVISHEIVFNFAWLSRWCKLRFIPNNHGFPKFSNDCHTDDQTSTDNMITGFLPFKVWPLY